MTATLRIKDGRYYAEFDCKGLDGQVRRVWRTLELEAKPENQRKAKLKMEELRYQLKDVIDVPGYGIAFTDFARDYMKKREGEVEETTYEGIINIVEKKIVPYFEPMNLSLSEVTSKHIKHFYEHLCKNGREDGKGGLSAASIKSIKNFMNAMFKMAVAHGLLEYNPAESVKAPIKDNPKKQYVVLSEESANRLLGFVMEDDLLYPLLQISLRYGLRRSEIVGLKWSAIDFEKGELRIETTIVSGKNPERNKTKTASSRARFPLLPDVVEMLRIRKQAQARDREVAGDAYIESGYVFTKRDGNFLNPNWVYTQFSKTLVKCGLPHMRFHDLRHTTTTLLFSKGMRLKELQKWIRHAKLQMTADVYLHISKEKEAKLTKGLHNMLSPSAKSKKDAIPSDFTLEN